MAILPYIVCFAIGIPLLNYFMNNQNFYQHIISVVNYFNSNILVFLLMIFVLSFLAITGSYLLSKKGILKKVRRNILWK